MKFDPHSQYNPNFSEEEWKYHKDYGPTISLANEIKQVIDRGQVAVVRNENLAELSFDVRCNTGSYPATWLQQSWSSVWSSIAICMLIHAKMEVPTEDTKTGVTRFEKSLVNNEPMFGDNLKFVTIRNSSYLHPAVVKEGFKIPDLPLQASLFDM